MTTISASVVLDSISPEGIRLTTLELEYPRWLHAEFMTHRVFSRNASSSRAIPIEKMIQRCIDNPAVPIHWTHDRPGMQGTERMSPSDRTFCQIEYRRGLSDAITRVRRMVAACSPHKQNVNRLLEPWAHIKVIVTSTDWENFFKLRIHPAAEPHMRDLALAVSEAMWLSCPEEIEYGGWHLPYINLDTDIQHAAITALERTPSLGGDEDKLQDEILTLLAMVSTARCARVSYLNHDGSKPRFLKDLALYDDLMTHPDDEPLHASPAEHQAQCDKKIGPTWVRPDLHGNLFGWKQFRKMHKNEAAKEYRRP